MVSVKDIGAIASSMKKYIEKNKTLPKSVTVNNVKYTYPEVAYILSASINNGCNKEVKKISVAKASNPTGDTFKNVKVKTDDYKDQAKRVSSFISKNGKLPNYVLTKDGKKRVRPRLFIYAFARIVVFYNSNGKKLPNYCVYHSDAFKKSTNNSSSTSKTTNSTSSSSATVKKTTNTTTVSSFKKYGHATRQGCDNIGQNTGYYCACHSLQEVFRNLTGKVVAQSTIASVCGTTTSGTDHYGMNTCVAWFNKKYGYNLTVEWKNFSDLGWTGIQRIVNSNNQDCVIHNLYRNQWGHYETVNAVSSSNVKVQNSLGSTGCGGCYCGYVENRSPSTFRSYINGISQKSVMVITRK